MLRLRRTIAALAVSAAAVFGTVGATFADSQTPVTGPPPGSAAWVADTTLGIRLPDPATASPAEVAALFDELPLAQQQALAVRHPLVVGNLDGAPVKLRFRANALALAEERDKALADPKGAAAAARYGALLADGRQILAFDPRGRGQVAEVLGDLTTATRTAVIVPGNDNDLADFDRPSAPGASPAAMAAALHAELARDSPAVRTAVIAWVGYTTPVGVGTDAATAPLARAGAVRLERFLSGLAATTRAPATVFCHSYGSVLCGLAAPALTPGQAAGLVVLGSPGMRADSAAGLHARIPLWATALDRDDWIREVPNVSLLGLGHGADPTGPGFGARVLSSAGAHGHSGYFAPGTDSLASYAAITVGDLSAVHCSTTDKECTDGL